MVAPRDTTSEAFARQLESLRSLSRQERLCHSLEMSDELREVATAGIRARHPEYADQQLREELELVVLGPDLARAVRRARSTASS
jgi:DNA-binding HxlR family transcriptional regulator